MVFGHDYNINIVTFNFWFSIGIFLQDFSHELKPYIGIYSKSYTHKKRGKNIESSDYKPIILGYKFRLPKWISYFGCASLNLNITGNIIHLSFRYKGSKLLGLFTWVARIGSNYYHLNLYQYSLHTVSSL